MEASRRKAEALGESFAHDQTTALAMGRVSRKGRGSSEHRLQRDGSPCDCFRALGARRDSRMRIGSLFSGIGGLELGLEWSGLGHTVWQVEQSEFCRRVLERHWPSVERFTDVCEVGAAELAPVDLICGGFPCQDISSAGKGAGLAGERSGLWYQFARIVEELSPRWVVVENVSSGARKWVDAVGSQLGFLGYETLPIPLSAADVGAPHLRRRVFIVAHSYGKSVRQQSRRVKGESGSHKVLIDRYGSQGVTSNTNSNSKPTESIDGKVGYVQTAAGHVRWGGGTTVSPVCGVDDGVSGRVDRLKALGNAVVPQCAEVVGWMIRLYMLNRPHGPQPGGELPDEMKEALV